MTRLQTTHTSLDLGTSLHRAGIQFFPGVWRGDPDASVDHHVGVPYEGGSMVCFSRDDCAVETERVSAAGDTVVRPKFSIGDHGFVSIVTDTDTAPTPAPAPAPAPRAPA